MMKIPAQRKLKLPACWLRGHVLRRVFLGIEYREDERWHRLTGQQCDRCWTVWENDPMGDPIEGFNPQPEEA